MTKQMEVSLRTDNREEIEFTLGRKLDATEQVIYDLQKEDDSYVFFVDGRGFLASRKIK